MRKLFVDFPIASSFALSADESHHILSVLRYRTGDTLTVSDSTGAAYFCQIERIEGQTAILRPLERCAGGSGAAGRVVLAAGLLKSDKFDWVVQKATELGVQAIVPVQMEHCVVKLNDERRRSRQERWQRLAREAAKQCGRDDIPAVQPVAMFSELLEAYQTYRFVVPYERETAPFARVCEDIRTGDVVVCIGPEGGFARQEIAAVAGLPWCRMVSMGPRILRAETASVAALAIIMYERGFK